MPPPSFDHLDFTSASSGAPKWAEYSRIPSDRLADTLYKHRPTWGRCIICDVDYPLTMASHIHGQKHCKVLFNKLGYRPPQSPQDLEQYTQYWDLNNGPKPFYFFNHVTCEQGYSDSAGAGNGVEAQPQQHQPPLQQMYQPQMQPHYAQPAAVPAPAPAAVMPGSDGVMYDEPGRAAGYVEAIKDKGKWKVYMEAPTKTLQDVLMLVDDWKCVVCESVMTNGAQEHLLSANHWKTLWNKLAGRGVPPLDVASDDKRPWVQTYQGTAGLCMFNHLTGKLACSPPSLLRGQAGPTGARSVAPAPVPAAVPVSAPAPVPVNYGGGDDWANGDDEVAALLGAGYTAGRAPAQAVQPTMTNVAAAAPPAAAANPMAGVGVNLSMEYVEGFKDKGSWRKFMEPQAKKLEDTFMALTGQWSAKCEVCDAEMGRGISDHLPSQNHWKKLWGKVQNTPPAATAHDWSKPWIQKFPTGRGDILFNHVTGAVLPPGEAPQPAAAAPAPPTPAVAPTPVAMMGAAAAATAGVYPPAAPNGHSAPRPASGFDLPLYVWSQHVREGAQKVAYNLRIAGQSQPKCAVCGTVITGDVVSHLQSAEHFRTLQSRLDQNGVERQPNGDYQVEKGPWVQSFTDTVVFNHITGQYVGQPSYQ
eukprot:TRINITY_DN29816_c0_g1_i1.p1 TRINITY_DN29816_c0_g1~~TRINITY_DN29816_c0_g1_i1.p1  ORF type:complete len:665 (+),score=134.18 TRINITY_DN29816_c0_g1_i1:70-1995(+)